MSDRSNILLIQCDQMTSLLIGIYGHPVIRTPNGRGIYAAMY